VTYLASLMEAFGLADRWAYRDEQTGDSFGLDLPALLEICRSADLFINVSCSTFMREEYLAIPVRILIDSDPMFTQIQAVNQAGLTPGSAGMRSLLACHTDLFSFGENIGRDDCRIPLCDHHWKPTRQPICLRHWAPGPAASPPEPDAGRPLFTTIMNWTAAKSLRFADEFWRQKDVEFLKVLSLPAMVPALELAIAVAQTVDPPFPRSEIEAHGWKILDPSSCVPDWRSYREFIHHSCGEFSVAKETYVKAVTGWFSCRSACYLASGRPVVAQDTGWSRTIPSGEGLFAFRDVADAAAGLLEIVANPGFHSRAARRIAEQFFDSRVVLEELLASVGA
jgi:hypothetical protein